LGVELAGFNRVNAGVITGPIDGTIEFNFTAATLLATGGVSCEAFSLDGTLNLNGGNLNCKAVVLGKVTTGISGMLVLASGRHSLGSVVKGGTGTANAITYGGTVNVGGDQTLEGIATDFGSASIKATAAVTINAQNATSVANNGADLFSDGGVKLLTIDYMPALAKPLRTWCGCLNGGHNADGAVVFHPGAPSALGMMGCGV
jgi:hypothetical protein